MKAFYWRMLIGVGGLLGSAWAAAADSTPVEAPGQNGLEEIIVTAQRRSENLERTPVAITVLSSDDLGKQQIVSEADLRTAVPGLTVRETVNSNQLNYSIRGQTVDAYSGSRPAVLPYVNEIQVGGPGGSSAFYDLQSIQVLKGPQGTLFGRNATGGAVLFTTAKPNESFGGYLNASAGNYNSAKVEGAINVPIIADKLLARVAAFYQTRDGFQYNIFTDHTLGDVDRYGVRGSVTLKVSERLKNDLVVDYAHSGGSSMALVLHSVEPQFGNNAPVPANLLYTPFLDTAIGFPGAFAIFSAANPKTPAGGLFAGLAEQNARGPYVANVNNPLAHLANNLIVSNVTTFEISDDLQFKNVFGYTNLRSADGNDADGTPYGIDGTPTGQKYGNRVAVWQFSEEPQLLGKVLGGDLSYVVGAYFSDEKTTANILSSFVDLEPLSAAANQNNDTLTRDKSYAGYGQGTYDLSRLTGVSGLSATAGVRYTSEKVKMDQLPTSSFYNSSVPYFHNSLGDTFNKASWQFGVQEQLNPDLLLYVVTRRSFRSGGFNNIAPPVEGFGGAGGAEFEAETATDVELGLKFQGNLGSIPTRLNIAAYSASIKNAQRVAYTVIAGAPGGITTNVPKTRVSGLELDGQINPATWLKLGVSLAYADAKFTDNQVTVSGTPPVTVGFGPYPDTPKWSGSVFSEVTVPVTNEIGVSLRGSLYDQTLTYFSSTNNTLTPGTELSGYAVADFRLSVDNNSAGWSVAAVLKNAFNRVYYVGGVGTLNVFTTNGAIPGDPRTFVGEIRYKF
jgi:iron complex outermembrane receptor protein